MWEKTTTRPKGPVIAVVFDQRIIVVQHHCTRELLIYNLVTALWRKYVIHAPRPAPPYLLATASARIESDIFVFGGVVARTSQFTNDLWKLTLDINGCLAWRKVTVMEQSPSPRCSHTVWEYTGKLWSYGGRVQAIYHRGYLNEYGQFYRTADQGVFTNQLMCFDPVSKLWTNLQCSGNKPCACYTNSTRIKDRVWLLCRLVDEVDFVLFRLDLLSLQWTRVTTGQIIPKPRNRYSFTSIDDGRIMLYGGRSHSTVFDDIWILDLTSKTWTHVPADYKGFCHAAVQCHYRECNTVFVIGGYTRLCNPVGLFCYYVGPRDNSLSRIKSLQSLALKCVDKNREKLPIHTLPKKFQDILLLPGEKISTLERMWNYRLRCSKIYYRN